MKTRIITLVTFLFLSFAGNAQIDRSKQPEPGPSPKIKLGKAATFTLKNGLKVIMVENHKLPRVSANLTIDNEPYFEGEKAGLSSMMGGLLGRGSKNITKDAFNEKVDYYGADVSFFSSGAFASSLKRYFPEILGLMADAVKNSTFTQEEFDKEQKIILDNLKNNEKNVTSIARRVEDLLTYGKDHPYGEFTSKESVNKITLADVTKNYSEFYKPNNAYLVIVGDFDTKEVKKLINALFADWQPGTIPTFTLPTPKNVPTTEINFIDMPNAVQSEIAVINNINLQLGDKDYFAAVLANQILGGGGTARLFQNLREDKGYTYGAYSSVRQSKYAGTFRASASVRNMVTDSSVVELMKEINTIRYKKVSEEDLKNVKEEYIGGFVMDVQKPATVASFALNMARYKLPTNFYETYLEKINTVTLEDIQNAALKYFQGDKARIIITGKGIDVLKNLENTDYAINYFDKEGNPTKKPAMTLPIPDGMTAQTVVDKYLAAIGGKDKVMAVKTMMMTANATIQETPIVMTSKMATPNKTLQEISVMGNVVQKSVFDGVKGFAEARGQKMDMTAEQISEAKAVNAIFSDLSYTKGTLDRIEPIDGKNMMVLKFNDTEVFYDMATWLKIQEVKTVKTPDGQEVKVPTTFGDYKEVKGLKFPYAIGQKMGPMDLNFEIKEIKINEGVSEADFK